MSVKGIRRMLVGEDMPDKNDPKYKKRYEKEVAAGRKFAKTARIDRAAAKVQGFANAQQDAVSRHRLRLCRHVLRHQHLQDGAVLRSSDGGCKCHRAAGRAHEADDECSPLHHSSRDASNQRGESRQVSNIKIRQR